MAIKILNTKAFGQIIGDVEERVEFTSVVKVIKPAYIQLQQNPQTGELGTAMMGIMTPFVIDSSQDYITLSEDDVVGRDLKGYTPTESNYNEYQKRFGSGFTLHTSPIIK